MQESSKIRVGILFGGKSAEHEVSLRSAKNVFDALDKNRYEPVLIGIDKTGKWHVAEAPDEAATSLMIDANATVVALLPGNTEGSLIDTQTGRSVTTVDVVFPILHGPLGEDGTVQGLLELANVPYVGPGVLGSAVGMDKDVMKRLLRDAGIPIAPFVTVATSRRAELNLAGIFEKFGTPLFVKPANMGSSVGVSRASNQEELQAALDIAFRFDTKVLIESAINGDEVECAVLGNEKPRASVLGRIMPREGDFYSYEAKYVDENGAVLEIPANLSDTVAAKTKDIALRTYAALHCEGMSRVDMFVTKDGEVIVNEVNTIPGFTKISMYPKLWEATGLSYSDLISELLKLAIERHQKRQALETSYEGHL